MGSQAPILVEASHRPIENNIISLVVTHISTASLATDKWEPGFSLTSSLKFDSCL
jgi:hypothetical protein